MNHCTKLLSLSLLASSLLSQSCGSDATSPEQDHGDPGDDTTTELGQLQSSLTAGFTLSGCSNTESRKLFAAMTLLLDEVTVNYGQLLSCVENAELIEYRGHSPRQIVDNLASSSISQITCKDLVPNVNGEAPVSISGSRLSLDRAFVNSNTETRVASVVAHELMHNRGYSHATNPSGTTYNSLTVPEQVERCVQTQGRSRAPNPWPGPGQPPSFDRIVGAHSDDACNCVYLVDGYASCGATDYLTRSTNKYFNYSVAPGRRPSDIVGMSQTGSLVCAFYNDGFVSCGSQGNSCRPVADLDSTRSAYRYTTAPGQSPLSIVGIGGDDSNNRHFSWYANGMVSGGSSDNLDSFRGQQGYDLAGGYQPRDVADMLSDGSFNCVIYKDGMVSCGSSDDMDSRRRLYESKF